MDITATIRTCIEKRLNIEINYRNSDREQYKVRIVSPHILLDSGKDQLLLIAKYVSGLTESEEKKVIRSYKISNILDASPTKYKFEIDESLKSKDPSLVAIASVF